LVFAYGLICGSFVNALVWRLHEQERGEVSKKRRRALSITRGRSMCPHCGHTLAITDLVPIFSWLVLRGRCRYCRKPIGWQYPLVELLTGLLFLISYRVWPYGFDIAGLGLFVAWLLLLTGLVALLVYDIRWMLLPNRIVYPLLGFWVGVTILLAVSFGRGLSGLLAASLGSLVCGGLFWLLFPVSDGRWIGGGDVKLGFLLGLLVGSPLAAFLVIFIASLLGTLFTLPFLVTRKLSIASKVAFGPFLIIAGIAVFLAGQPLLEVIARLFLLQY
jgi:leader peptidase (prepilin peptidase)/N-methyltransferase